MPSDRSRSIDKAHYGYTAPVFQQGRVLDPRDFNALQGLTADRIAADALDFVGPCGTPDDGFRISLPVGSPPSPPFWSPPGGLPGSPPQAPGGHGDFLIAPGTMYVGGERVTFPREQNGKPVTYSYLDQPDWPAPLLPATEPQFELVYLELNELEVSAVEDPDLFEVAFGGPDTTQRLKLLRRVRRMKVAAASCTAAWDEAVKTWAAAGWQFDPATMRLEPLARLKVGFTQDTSTHNPCDPVASGGFLGADNQLIRVRIAGSGSNTQLIWSYDNASFLYRVTSVSSDGKMLTLASDPPDAFHVPQTGQLVEVLRTAAVLGEEPDETDPTGTRNILRVAAEPNGTLGGLAQPYGPVTSGDPTKYIVLGTALPADVAKSPLPLFLRVWQATLPFAAGGAVVTITDPVTGISTGVTATISSTVAGQTLADGAFWQIAVRPATPQGAYPEDLLVAPQPPDGPRLWACPLAVISWTQTGGTITDCRNVFDDLVTLTRRKPGCCTVSIAPSDTTAATSLQTLINRAATLATTVTVCLSPGQYPLPGTLYLDKRHSNMTLESCGGPAILLSQTLADLTPFTDGLVVVEGAVGVTFRGLTLRPPVVQSTAAFFQELTARLTSVSTTNVQATNVQATNVQFTPVQAAQVFRQPNTSFGIRVVNTVGLTLEDCVIQIALTNNADTAAVRLGITADLFAAAVFLQGNCSALKIKDCAATSTITPTYTKLQLDAAVALPNSLKILNDLLTVRLPESAPAPASPPASPTPQLPLPPASPPVSEQVLLDNRISGALELVAARRLAVGAAAPNFAIVTVGVLAAGSVDGACELGESAVRGSEFTGLTFATWFSADVQILRLQDNTINNGVAGLWLEVPDAANPRGAIDKPAYYPQMILFEEYQLLLALAATFPRPTLPRSTTSISINTVIAAALAKATTAAETTATARVLAAGTVSEAATVTAAAAAPPPPVPPFSLLVTGNQVDVRPQTTTVGTSAALMFALYRNPLAQPLTSVVISANRLCGGMSAPIARGFPAAASPQIAGVAPIAETATTVASPQIAQAAPIAAAVASPQIAKEAPIAAAAAPVVSPQRAIENPIILPVVPQIRNEVPAALVALTNGTACSITGNVVINRGATAAAVGLVNDLSAPSLWLTVSDSADGVLQLAVTGNVLNASSDLSEILRRGLKNDTWLLYNADPS